MKPCTWTAIVVLVGGVLSDGQARTITVAQTGTADTQFIEEAIALASTGDTIRVAAGTYSGGGFSIDKSLTLIGAGPDSTIFQYGWETSIGISAAQVTIEGFTFIFHTDGRAAAARSSVMFVDRSPILRGNRFTSDSNYNEVAALVLFGDARPIIQYNEFLTTMGIHLINNPHPIDARFNWWDTDDRTTIQEKIWDGADEDGLGLVTFEPWLQSPGGPVRTAVRPLSWGNLKRMHSSQEGGDNDCLFEPSRADYTPVFSDGPNAPVSAHTPSH